VEVIAATTKAICMGSVIMPACRAMSPTTRVIRPPHPSIAPTAPA
jgi:hypothetical protein